jgi:hypothetical protein
MEYQLLTTTIEKFNKRLKEAVDGGWVPRGSHQTTFVNGKVLISQMMKKRVDRD